MLKNYSLSIIFFIVCQPAIMATTLKVAFDNEPRAFDARYAVDANAQYLMDLIDCALINFDENGQTIPDLAESFRWISPTTIAFKLKKNVQFSDGRALTPEDVKATYEFFKKKDVKTPSPFAPAFQKITSIDIKKDELIFTLAEADTSFAQNFMIGILPKSLAEGEVLTDVSKHVGCGAYKIKEFSVGSITLEKNANYSLAKPAALDGVEIKIVKDEQTRFAKLVKGEVDLIQNGLSRDKLAGLEKSNPQLKIQKRLGLNVYYLGFNFKDPVLAKPNVRRAIAMAINRPQIIEYILKGMAKPAKTILPETDPFFDRSLKDIAFDPNAAKKLLDEEKLKDPDGDGKQPRFQLSYKTSTDTTRVSIAQAIASQLGKVGIKVNVGSLEWGKLKADVEKGQVQMWSLNWIGFKDPDIYRHAFLSTNAPPNGSNRGWYANPKLDELLNQAKATEDTAKRKRLYIEVQKIVAEDLPYVFLWHEESFAVYNKKVSGFKLFADGRLSSLKTATIKP